MHIFYNNIFYRIFIFPIYLNSIIKKNNISKVVIHNYGLCINSFNIILLNLIHSYKVKIILEVHHIEGFIESRKINIGLEKLLSFIIIKFYKNKPNVQIRFVNKSLYNFFKKKGYRNINLVYSMYVNQKIFFNKKVNKIWDFIFINRLHKNKNINFLVKIIRFLLSQNLNYKFLIIGHGHEIKKIIRIIKNHPNSIDYYKFIKNDETISNLINSTKYLLITSNIEGGPRTFIESLICGTKVITTEVGLTREFDSKNIIKINEKNFKDQLFKEKLKNHFFLHDQILTNKLNYFKLDKGLENYSKFINED